MALMNAGLGDPQAVLDWLEKAYAARDVHLIFLPVIPSGIAIAATPTSNLLLPVVGSRE